MKYWFTADYHLGHANIIKYCNRPFKNLEHMNSEIIRRHNSRIKPNDTVFFLGDFCFKNSKNRGEGINLKAEHWINKLNGNIIFIKGNHDSNNSLKTIIEKIIIYYSGKYFCLVHNPEYVDIDVPINLVGHVHDKWKFKRIRKGFSFTDAINVGVDVWNFYPITINEILKEYSKWLKKLKN